MISGLSSPIASTIQTASAYANTWRVGRSAEQDTVATGERSGSAELSADDQRQVESMKATDHAVRAHEAAHMAAGGHLVTSGASFTYETGPDGQRYAVAGEVGIDTSRGRTPEETLARAEQIRSAALAPADPSGQDRAVAAAAAQMAAEARAEIARANMEKGKTNEGGPPEKIARTAGEDRATAFGHAIERSLSPGERSVDIYA